jgi:hypothetical protein
MGNAYWEGFADGENSRDAEILELKSTIEELQNRLSQVEWDGKVPA